MSKTRKNYPASFKAKQGWRGLDIAFNSHWELRLWRPECLGTPVLGSSGSKINDTGEQTCNH